MNDTPTVGVRITRRQLLLLGGAVVGTGLLAVTRGAQAVSAAEAMRDALGSVARQEAPATSQTGGLLDRAAPSVTPLAVAAEPVFGPPTDIAAGWDGTLWAIDGAGAPHVYDRAQKSWQFYGSRIDAIVRPTASQAATPGGQATPVGDTAQLFMAPLLAASATAQPTTTPTPGPGHSATPTPVPHTPASTASPTRAPTSSVSPSSTPTGTASPLATATPSPTPTAATSPTPTPTVGSNPAEVVGTAAPPATYVFRGPEVLVRAMAACDAFGLQPGDLIQVAGNPEVDIVAPGCLRRHVPNPLTLEVINGRYHPRSRVLAAADFQLIQAGPPIPEIFNDPDGFLQAMREIFGRTEADDGPSTSPADQEAARFDALTLAAATPNAPVATSTSVSRTPTPSATATSASASATPTPGASATDASGAPTATASAATPTGTPRLIADVWPNLPASFKLGVDGAAYAGGVLYLFKAGRFVRADGAQAASKLSDLKGWPQSGPWQDGLVDLVVGLSQPAGVALIRGGQFIVIEPAQSTVTQGPKDLGSLLQGDLLKRARAGQLDALLYTSADQPVTAVEGPAVLSYANSSAAQPASRQYLPLAFADWPATWNPLLQQAPSGRVDGLWATTRNGVVVHHDGSNWSETERQAVSVAVGVDGSVFAIGSDADQHQLLRLDGSAWTLVAQAAGPLAQVAVGDTSRVWVRDTSNAVHRLDQSDANALHLVPEPLLGQAVHIDASNDGTVWSCNQGGGASRFVSESTAPPQAVATGGATRVTSTSFGTAHFLVQQNGANQVHEYNSPYIFKTSKTYQVGRDATGLAQGLGRVFLLTVDRTAAPVFAIVALDAHTGEELSVSLVEAGRIYTPPVFDPIHELVYIGVAPLDPQDHSSGGELRALNPRNLLEVVWSYPTPAGVDAAPALFGTSLCFGDRTTTLHMLDTSPALAGGKPTLRWQWQTFTPPQPQPGTSFSILQAFMPTPLLANGNVYAMAWVTSSQRLFANGPTFTFLGQSVAVCGAGDSSNQASGGWSFPVPGAEISFRANQGLALGRASFNGETRTAVFAVLDARLVAINVQDLTGLGTILPADMIAFYQANATIASSLTYDNGVLWFGDYDGNLYAIDENLKSVHQTPVRVGQGGSSKGLLTAPLPYQGSILCGVADEERPGRLVAFDPSSGTLSTLDTGQTAIGSFSGSVSNGVIYAAGTFTIGSADPRLVPQALGIRVDALVQDQRDFIVESQLMQDFDDPSQPTHNPNGVARYQTHLTIVDENKAPRPREAVKIWADRPTTLVVDGQSYTVGPADSEYAAVQTGTDGTLTIVSGSVKPDGSDKPDLFAPTLRLWASFMDTHERILVQPDREFHNRLATAHATAGDDDPTRVNLHDASAYGNKPLFTSAQKQQNAPQQVALAIQDMTRSVGVGTGGTTAIAWVRRTTDTPGRYLAYDDLPGSTYSAVNVRSTRPAAVAQPLGLHLSANATGGVTRTPLSPADAATAIDQLKGAPWGTTAVAAQAAGLSGRVGDPWGDFWGWLKGEAATVTDVVVSIANDIAIGIRFIANGIVQVFNQVLQTLDNVVAAIGSFFKQLAIDIENAIQALGVLFKFDEIVKTHNFLKNEFLTSVNGIDGDPVHIGFTRAVNDNVIPEFNSIFATAEKTVSDWFTKLAGDVTGARINQLQGQGATTHTLYSVAPKDGSQPTSQTTQCSWGMQKFKAGLPGARGGRQATALVGQASPAWDPTNFQKFIDNFVNKVATDPVLKSKWDAVQQGAQGHAASVSDFLTQALGELLNTLALLVDGALTVTNAFLVGFLGLIDGLVELLLGSGPQSTGLLTERIDIPVLTWLYENVIVPGGKFTLLDAVTLVAAIPVTLLWRIAEGQWPSQSLNNATSVGATPAEIRRRVVAVYGAIMTVGSGFINGLSDALFGQANPPEDLTRDVTIESLAFALGTAVANFPLLASARPAPLEWVTWVYGMCASAVNLFGLSSLLKTGQAVSGKLTSGITSALSILQLILVADQWANQPSHNVLDDVNFGFDLAACIVGVLNPVKFLGEQAALVIGALDAVMGLALGILQIVDAFERKGAATLPAALPAG
ncbi:MAG: PQQ-binding-like beta-propeller repeat protein [Chloroflexi bacterium]|nr:PQQ-binding-like beta-propeller repeat protein [Chloroflexota bacterium]